MTSNDYLQTITLSTNLSRIVSDELAIGLAQERWYNDLSSDGSPSSSHDIATHTGQEDDGKTRCI